jgi:hypothetical protein
MSVIQVGPHWPCVGLSQTLLEVRSRTYGLLRHGMPTAYYLLPNIALLVL